MNLVLFDKVHGTLSHFCVWVSFFLGTEFLSTAKKGMKHAGEKYGNGFGV